ncbi:hypothetical protein [Haematobacter genomosp. 1]|uniref:hypothetical protein n=1 Tax=Haematobacter genomosp. 1 TaxID=366618 RepID=UPI00117B2717|nr:hypothetical protein [Haematobacter genomosp. 1]
MIFEGMIAFAAALAVLWILAGAARDTKGNRTIIRNDLKRLLGKKKGKSVEQPKRRPKSENVLAPYDSSYSSHLIRLREWYHHK